MRGGCCDFLSWSLTNFIKISMGIVLLSLLIKSKTNPPSTHWIKTDITAWYLEIFSIVHLILCSLGYDFTFCKWSEVNSKCQTIRMQTDDVLCHDVREAFSSFEDFLTLIYTSVANNCNVAVDEFRVDLCLQDVEKWRVCQLNIVRMHFKNIFLLAE